MEILVSSFMYFYKNGFIAVFISAFCTVSEIIILHTVAHGHEGQ